ncbi:hypothetical protein [Massilia sp.]|uniref:hypothetical protein n=1 Tax=Massilia sp. TaxID=1882437 RepID=UPI00391CC38C
MNQQPNQKQSQPDNSQTDPSKDLVSAAGQGQREGNQQSGSQQSGQQQMGQQGNQQQGSQQQGNQQQGGGQHASGGTPALDDLDGQNQGESAQQASEAFRQQDGQGGNR